MFVQKRWVLLGCLLLSLGCSRGKSTDELIADLKSNQERDRIIAVRLLPNRKNDAAKIVPVMIECLNDQQGDVRLSAAIGLGMFGEEARMRRARVTSRDEGSRRARAAGRRGWHCRGSIRPLRRRPIR